MTRINEMTPEEIARAVEGFDRALSEEIKRIREEIRIREDEEEDALWSCFVAAARGQA